jgi:hypothetical protein
MATFTIHLREMFLLVTGGSTVSRSPVALMPNGNAMKFRHAFQVRVGGRLVPAPPFSEISFVATHPNHGQPAPFARETDVNRHGIEGFLLHLNNVPRGANESAKVRPEYLAAVIDAGVAAELNARVLLPFGTFNNEPPAFNHAQTWRWRLKDKHKNHDHMQMLTDCVSLTCELDNQLTHELVVSTRLADGTVSETRVALHDAGAAAAQTVEISNADVPGNGGSADVLDDYLVIYSMTVGPSGSWPLPQRDDKGLLDTILDAVFGKMYRFTGATPERPICGSGEGDPP